MIHILLYFSYQIYILFIQILKIGYSKYLEVVYLEYLYQNHLFILSLICSFLFFSSLQHLLFTFENFICSNNLCIFLVGNNKLINASHFKGGSTLIQKKQEIPNQLLAKISKLTNTSTNRT